MMTQAAEQERFVEDVIGRSVASVTDSRHLPTTNSSVRSLLSRIKRSSAFPPHWRKLVRVLKILTFEYGYLRSVAAEKPFSGDGTPYPWYTYPALEYLKQLDFGGKRVFEYGCGHSTLFWAARAGNVVSVEHNQEWHDLVRANLPDNCTLLYEPDSDAYAAAIERFDEPFDVVIVDGLVTGRTRLKCVRRVVARLRRGGMIILDNSDWLPESSRHLREAGLIEVDMTGFAPINDYICTTSIYLHRDFSFSPLHDRQPMPGVGAHMYNWEAGAMEERLARARALDAV